MIYDNVKYLNFTNEFFLEVFLTTGKSITSAIYTHIHTYIYEVNSKKERVNWRPGRPGQLAIDWEEMRNISEGAMVGSFFCDVLTKVSPRNLVGTRWTVCERHGDTWITLNVSARHPSVSALVTVWKRRRFAYNGTAPTTGWSSGPTPASATRLCRKGLVRLGF